MTTDWVILACTYLVELQGIWTDLRYSNGVLACHGVPLPQLQGVVNFTEVHDYMVSLLGKAIEVEQSAMARARKAFADWAKQAIAGGAKVAHTYTRHRVYQHVIDYLWSGSQAPPHPKDAADHELGKWKPIWGWGHPIKTWRK